MQVMFLLLKMIAQSTKVFFKQKINRYQSFYKYKRSLDKKTDDTPGPAPEHC